MRDDFVVFILTHGRANQMHTDVALRNAGYTGKIIYIIDNEDPTANIYYEKFGKDSVYMFNKTEFAKKVDTMDLSVDRRAIVYARGACYEIAKELGYKYFLELDDDYSNFRSRVVDGKSLKTVYIKDFVVKIINILPLTFYISWYFMRCQSLLLLYTIKHTFR